jgi:hypothetical protein
MQACTTQGRAPCLQDVGMVLPTPWQQCSRQGLHLLARGLREGTHLSQTCYRHPEGTAILCCCQTALCQPSGHTPTRAVAVHLERADACTKWLQWREQTH